MMEFIYGLPVDANRAGRKSRGAIAKEFRGLSAGGVGKGTEAGGAWSGPRSLFMGDIGRLLPGKDGTKAEFSRLARYPQKGTRVCSVFYNGGRNGERVRDGFSTLSYLFFSITSFGGTA